MKTIEVDDSLYSKLLDLAIEVRNQNSHGTGSPYLFQIRTDDKVWDSGLGGDNLMIMDDDWNEVGPFDLPTLVELSKRATNEPPCPLDDDFDLILYRDELRDWLKDEFGYIPSSYTIKDKLQNGFLTQKACQAHIDGNRHHYVNPTFYVSHAFRNSELDLFFRLLDSFSGLPF